MWVYFWGFLLLFLRFWTSDLHVIGEEEFKWLEFLSSLFFFSLGFEFERDHRDFVIKYKLIQWKMQGLTGMVKMDLLDSKNKSFIGMLKMAMLESYLKCWYMGSREIWVVGKHGLVSIGIVISHIWLRHVLVKGGVFSSFEGNQSIISTMHQQSFRILPF